ncbi:hypothetical protein ACSBR1_033109 [Camellia fascicularis]
MRQRQGEFSVSRFAFMENPEDSDTGSPKAENATELKKELERQIKPIIDEDDYETKPTDEAIRILSSLKELEVKEIEMTNEAIRFISSSKELKCKVPASYMAVPEKFKCPISREIMGDPVVLVTGQVRASIQSYFLYQHLGFSFLFLEIHSKINSTLFVLLF